MIQLLIQWFLKAVLNLFFREIRVRGSHNVPLKDPVLFAVAPHANQFIDPLMLFNTCGRKVGFLAAKKSMDKFWIGLFARAFNSISVERPQDLVKKGKGTIFVDSENNLKIIGINTEFSKFTPKTTITLPNDEGSAVVASVVSDTELLLSKPFSGQITNELFTNSQIGTTYTTTPHVDQGNMFKEVVSRLSKDGAVGIFPEGGSHDRPEMLPLKAGVAIMALETISKYPGCKLKIVPVGIHYFHADKFRSRTAVEYGEQIEIPLELVDQFNKGGADKRQAIGLLLDTIHVRLKAITVQAADFDMLMVAQAARRLYQPKDLDADAALTLARRFATAFETMKDHPKVIALTDEVREYNRMLRFYGVQDHQVKNTRLSVKEAFMLIIYRCVEVFCLFILSLPMIVLASPLLFLTKKVSHEKAIEAKAGSKVKIAGKDVISTWKLLTALAVVPILWISYTFIAFVWYYFTTGFSAGINAAIITAFGLPLLSMASIRLSQTAFDVVKSIRPLIVSLGNALSSSEPLREMRDKLQKKVRELVDELLPEFFPDFEDNRVAVEVISNSGYDAVSANKLGRGKNLNVENMQVQISEAPFNTVFGDELDKVKMD